MLARVAKEAEQTWHFVDDERLECRINGNIRSNKSTAKTKRIRTQECQKMASKNHLAPDNQPKLSMHQLTSNQPPKRIGKFEKIDQELEQKRANARKRSETAATIPRRQKAQKDRKEPRSDKHTTDLKQSTNETNSLIKSESRPTKTKKSDRQK